MAFTRNDIVEKISNKLGSNKRESRAIVEGFFEEIRATLEKGKSVKLSGFGTFDLRDKGERPGRNPKTKEEVVISPRRVVTFHAGQKLKDRVKQYVGPELEQD